MYTSRDHSRKFCHWILHSYRWAQRHLSSSCSEIFMLYNIPNVLGLWPYISSMTIYMVFSRVPTPRIITTNNSEIAISSSSWGVSEKSNDYSLIYVLNNTSNKQRPRLSILEIAVDKNRVARMVEYRTGEHIKFKPQHGEPLRPRNKERASNVVTHCLDPK